MDAATIAAAVAGLSTLTAVILAHRRENRDLAALGSRVDELKGELKGDIASLEKVMLVKFAAVDVKFVAVDQRFNDLDKRLQSDLKRIEEQHDWNAIQAQLQQDARERQQMRADIQQLKELIRK